MCRPPPTPMGGRAGKARRQAWFLWFGLLFLIVGCGRGGLPFLTDDESLAGPRVPYTVLFEGVDEGPDPGLEAYLRAASNAAQSTDRPPPSLLILRNRARDDLSRLVTALQARGFYDGTVDFRIEQDDAADQFLDGALDTLLGTAPTRIVFMVDTGEIYRFGKRTIRVEGDPERYDTPRVADLGVKDGDPALAELVLEAEDNLLRHAQARGHALAELGQRRVIIDRDTRLMDVELAIRPGPTFKFAQPSVIGHTDIDDDFVHQRLLIEPGSRYDIREVERARRRLIDTNLFATVRVIEGPEPDAAGDWPVTFEVTERLHRTVGAGVGFLTDEGPLVRAFWEHRNILGAGELFRAEADVGQSLQRVEGRLRKPDIFIPDLDLIGGGVLRLDQTDAFDSRSIRGDLGVERRFSRRLTGTVGVAYQLSDVEDPEDAELFGIFSVPVGLRYDASDDLLDPSLGFRITAETAPSWDTLHPGTNYVKNQLIATRYFRIANDPRLVLAFRGAAGAIVGAEIEDIPAIDRFYAGGGGSIRGIPFQLAGPLDDNDDPTGGRSLLEANAELRYQLFGNVETVLFLDGGSAFEEQLPQFGDAWQFGAGTGIRYLTPVGPIRFDVGVPIDRREGIDDAWQLYISIGQAF
jgi:translocation and assembly module TamA